MPFVYKITNTVNNKTYVGMVKKPGKSVQTRFEEHCLRCSSKYKTLLLNAMKSYGTEHFRIEQLEECTKDNVQDREKYWIGQLNPEYNMTKGGDGGSTTHNRKWYNNGLNNLYVIDGDDVPTGYSRGRICAFSDPEIQRELSSRVNRAYSGQMIKKAWDEGRMSHRDNSRLGRKSEDNVAKRPEVRKKISQAMTGKRWPEERRKARSESMKGKPFPGKSSD